MAKIKINELAKQLGMANKELLATLKENGIEKKSTMSSLDDTEFNILFEVLTKSTDDGKRMEEYLKE